MSGEFKDCPIMCPSNSQRRYDVFRTELCGDCPRGKKMRAFTADTMSAWGRWLSDEQREGLDFNEMLIELYRASSLRETDPESLDLISSALVNVFEDEDDRYERQLRETT